MEGQEENSKKVEVLTKFTNQVQRWFRSYSLPATVSDADISDALIHLLFAPNIVVLDNQATMLTGWASCHITGSVDFEATIFLFTDRFGQCSVITEERSVKLQRNGPPKCNKPELS